MSLRLARNGLIYSLCEQPVVFRCTQRRAQIGAVVLAKAHIKHAGTGDAHTVAAFAEIMRQRRDEPEPPARFGDAYIACRAAGAIITIFQLVAACEVRADKRKRQVLIHARRVDFAERHGFDQRQIHPAAMRPEQHGFDLVLVHLFERHHVDFHRQSCRLCGIDSGQHLFQIATARDGAEFGGVTCVERNIDASHPSRMQFARETRELAAICRECQFTEPVSKPRAQPPEELHHIAAHERFSARYANALHAFAHKSHAQPFQFFQRQKLRPRQEWHVLRHAIDATEIATVCHRNPEIGNPAAKRIDHAVTVAQPTAKI